jgi:dynein intermediate chain 1
LFSGFYDGSVAVYNIADEKKRPKYQSTARNGKHTDPVWQVRRRFSAEKLDLHCLWI